MVSRLGGYIVRHFIADMMFLENIMMDTFIADDEVWKDLKDLTSSVYSTRDITERVKLRKKRVQIFYEYLSRCYDRLREESIRRGLPKEWCTHPFQNLAVDFRNNLQRVERSAERNYGSQRSEK